MLKRIEFPLYAFFIRLLGAWFNFLNSDNGGH